MSTGRRRHVAAAISLTFMPFRIRRMSRSIGAARHVDAALPADARHGRIPSAARPRFRCRWQQEVASPRADYDAESRASGRRASREMPNLRTR